MVHHEAETTVNHVWTIELADNTKIYITEKHNFDTPDSLFLNKQYKLAYAKCL